MLGRLNPTLACLMLLLTAASFSGCLTNGAAASGKDSAPLAAVAAGGPASQDASSTPSHAGARAIPITGVYADYPSGEGASFCTQPPACHVYFAFGINFTGTLHGEAVGVAHESPDDPAHPDHVGNFEKNPVTFTGGITGCGSGSLGFIIHGYFQPTTQGLLTNETLRYVPGSASTGLAGVVDLFASFDGDPYAWPGAVKLTGTVWCR